MVQSTRGIVDLMHKTSHKVLQVKWEAMQQGDKAVLNQVGGGKDIMSILHVYIFIFAWSEPHA